MLGRGLTGLKPGVNERDGKCWTRAAEVSRRRHLLSVSSISFLLVFLASASLSQAQVQNGEASFTVEQLQPGQFFSLTGDWLYKPGYAAGSNASAQAVEQTDGCVTVPVPQLLNRIRWWLDDSEDFKKYEEDRLRKLGFDTEKAEDGWYRLALELPALPKGRRLFLEFEGVAMKCKAFCNGRLLGEHAGMFSSFGFDLTRDLKTGTNIIAVFVSMEKIPKSDLEMGEAVTVNLTASKVRSMSKGMFGPLAPSFDNRSYDLHGIWQPVRLVVRGPAKLDEVWFAPSTEGAEVRIEASAMSKQAAFLKAKWTDVETDEVFAEIEREKISLNKSAKETLWLRDVKPKLWTPADPKLYRLEVTLEDTGGQVLDTWSRKIGFRTFEIRGNQFFLNGQQYWLRGADHLPYGKNPFDPKLARRLIQLLHDANVRITRTHATPWNEDWLGAADEIGLAVSVEGIRPWGLAGKIGPTPPALFQHWLMENADVIKRCRNHPSVFLYTVGNEMMLRDSKNLEKWKQLSTVVSETRRADPTRPVIASSEYQRDPETYRTLLHPNGIDDGDVDDIHRYLNWYGPSSFVKDSEFATELKSNIWKRPFIGQEMSSGYPDLDTGLPVLRYTRDLLTPQAWIGQQAYPGSDPSVFLEHHRAVTKRWAEQLRFQRGNQTAGFMLFAAECWFSHSYDAALASPYPVYAAVKEAWAPLGIALETGRRRFYADEEIETALFVTNDDERFQDHHDVQILFGIQQEGIKTKMVEIEVCRIPTLAYYETKRIPVRLRFPKIGQPRQPARLILRALENNAEVSRTTDRVELFDREVEPLIAARPPFEGIGVGNELAGLCVTALATAKVLPGNPGTAQKIMIFGTNDTAKALTNGPYRTWIEQGGTAILMSPGAGFSTNFPGDILEEKRGEVEFADWAPIAGTALAEGLAPMDLKWWGREHDLRVFIGSQSHRLKSGGKARELLRYIPPHSYISADKVAEQYRTVLFEIPLGRGRVWVCDLDLEACIAVDPCARAFAKNLVRAAANPGSTALLPRMKTHAELLEGGRGGEK